MSHILTNAKENASYDGTVFNCLGPASGAFTTVKSALGRAYNKETGLTTSVSDGEVGWYRVHYQDQTQSTNYAIFEGTYEDDDDTVTPISGSIVLSSSGTSMPDFPSDESAVLFIQGVAPAEAFVDDQWHEVGSAGEPAFQNSWVNYEGGFEVARFKKLRSGLVVLSGMVKNGTNDTTVFTLPERYRPSERILMASSTYDDTYCRLDVTADGLVRPLGSSNTWLSINISFLAEQ